MIQHLAHRYFSHRRKRIDRWITNPIDTQHRLLRRWMPILANTTYGKSYGLLASDAYTAFCQKLPCVFYEDIEPHITQCRQGHHQTLWHRPIKWFAKSSGTTNAQSKFIPLSAQSISQNHLKAGVDLLAFYFQNYPKSKLFKGKTLQLGGSHEVYAEGKSKYGDLSAVLVEHMPFWAAWVNIPSKKISLMAEWEAKMERIVAAVSNRDVRALAGVPSWMLILLRRVLEQKGEQTFERLWPNVELYLHGGINFEPYRATYAELFPHPLRYVEVYNASEGFFAFQDQRDSRDLLLLLDHGVFYEFIPMSVWGQPDALQKAVPLEGVETGKNYAMVITTCSGLCRYIIGDTVRFTSTTPYRIRITGRTKLFINAFGEEVVIENADTAIQEACLQTGARVAHYTVAPRYISWEGEADAARFTAGCHEWIIEFEKAPSDMSRFEKVLDQKLQAINSDYAAKRYMDMTMVKPKIHRAPTGLFYRWLEQRGKLGGQNKVPKLHNHREVLDQLLALGW